MSNPDILVDREGNLGWIRINKPDRLNAFSGTMREDLDTALEWLERDSEVRCVIITGVGRAFSTGGDISVMKELIANDDVVRFESLVRAGARVVQRIDDMTKPVIASINGPAAGAGACLALACDLRIASETATIGFGFLRVGLHPDWGGSYFLPRIVGPALAAEFAYTGDMINAERAVKHGLFNRIVPAGDLESTVRTLGGQLAAAPAAVMIDLRRNMRRSLHTPLGNMLDAEVSAQLRAFQTADFKEGIESFLEKRTPRFGRTAK
jgi:2-(1,2-epoxy-1,2-dihydrophenyl)acetyl-CoA isomerase